MTDLDLKPSLYPFAPLKAALIPDRLTMAAMDNAFAFGSVDGLQCQRIMLDLNRRAKFDGADLDQINGKAMSNAAALGAIDALHIEWGSTDRDDFDQLEMWERLGRILRSAGV